MDITIARRLRVQRKGRNITPYVSSHLYGTMRHPLMLQVPVRVLVSSGIFKSNI